MLGDLCPARAVWIIIINVWIIIICQSAAGRARFSDSDSERIEYLAGWLTGWLLGYVIIWLAG